MSMAHGLEARTPFLDHPLVELAATIPADIKFRGGRMKRVLKDAMAGVLPAKIADRKDKMGFPVPFTEWVRAPGLVRDFVVDTLGSEGAQERGYINGPVWDLIESLGREPKFGRKIWGLLCLELWQQEFHDKQSAIRFKE